MGDFPPAKEQGNFHLVPFFDETLDMPKLKLKIMVFGPGPDFDFFHMNYGLVFFGLRSVSGSFFVAGAFVCLLAGSSAALLIILRPIPGV